MRVIDLHTDTPIAVFKGQSCLMASEEHISKFSSYLQCSALFCPRELSDEEGYAYICSCLQFWKQKHSESIVEYKEKLKKALLQRKYASVLSIEDARILNGDLARVDALFTDGVRIMTPMWKGVNLLGGAWDTDVGLSPFGRLAARRFLVRGGILDLSHASRESHRELVALCKEVGRAPLASHSNAYTITKHPRNLTDDQIREIAALGGVIGLNLYPLFLNGSGDADMQDILSHIHHVFKVGGAEVLALGSDFDGISALPCGMQNAADLVMIAEAMQKEGFLADRIDAFFYKNAARYLLENFP